MSAATSSRGADWDFELLERYDTAIAEVAGEYGLETYPNQIEIITSEQMLDAYATSGLPVGYPHWSYGKEFIRNEQAYRRGMQGLAYEIVINSNPCIAYLMEENTITTQALVIAHACYGHNSFFKGNHLFRQWTAADAILDYLVFARGYVMECEERHGAAAVEEVLDACHALMPHGVDRYRRPAALTLQGRGGPARPARSPSRAAVQRPVAHGPGGPGGANDGERRPSFRRSRRRTSSTSSRSIRRSSSPWQRELSAHRAQARPVLLSAGPDQGDERGLGDVLALHDRQPAAREGAGRRRLHARVPEEPHQRHRAARHSIRARTAARIRTRSASRCSAT